MGRTLASYRRMLEKERALWQKNFASRLRGQNCTSFNKLWERAFQLADAASANTRPVVFDNVIMSMMVELQSEVDYLRRELMRIKEALKKIEEENS
ncbi:MAG: hypothetical protein ACTSW1_06360 [Candidatus Hodarchaeales archaeon]